MVDALASGLPVAAEHAQVLERLRQLTAWQQAQQERLRAVQQEQIARLRGDLSSAVQPSPPRQIAAELPPQTPAEPLSSVSSGPNGGDEVWTSLQRMAGSPGLEETVRGEGSVSDSGLETGGRVSDEESQPQQLPATGNRFGEDRPIQPGMGEGDTFEDMLERQLQLHSQQQNKASPGHCLKNKPRPFLKRGEGLARYGGGQRSPKTHVVKKMETKSQPVNKMASGSAHQSVVGGEQRASVLGSQFSSDESFIIRGCQRVQQEEAELVEFEELEKAAFDTSSFSQCSLVTAMLGGERTAAALRLASEEDDKQEPEVDLDKTLTPLQAGQARELTEAAAESERVQSLAAGLVFSDDEEWESFRRDSPPPSHTVSSQPRTESSGSPSPWTSPVKQQSSTPLPLSPTHTSSPPPQPHSSHSSTEDLTRETTPSLTGLTLKLFPALKQRKEELKPQIKSCKVQHPDEKATHPVATPTQCPNESEVRERMSQLESEIERFRSLNSRLEQQTREKEEGLRYLRGEIAEFQRQRQQEVAQFEQYKREEMGKLKRERRVFEVYVQQSRAGQEKRDKEQLEALRSQVAELQEELERSRERWRSALARHRQREEALEAQNRELVADLKMMERERLTWWQEQLEKREESPSPPPLSPGPARRPVAGRSQRGRAGGQGRKPGRGRGRGGSQTQPERGRKSPPAMRSGPSVGGGQCAGGDDRDRAQLTTCEIVEVVSHDLSPPQSDLWSGSEAGSDVSALAEAIVERVVGPRVGGCGQGAESDQGAAGDGEKAVKSGKSVRFAVQQMEAAEEYEEEEGESSQQPRVLEQEDGSRLTVCANGTRKVVTSDGKSVSLSFVNGDTKHIKPDGTVVYFYCQSQTTHTTHPSGLEELHFPNEQVEKVFPDGRKEVRFPDGTVRTVHPTGEEESVFSDGTVQRLLADGTRQIHYSNGQRETHTPDYKRREYPDGTVKTVFPDGRQETRYASGRLRVKDSSGRVLLDSWNNTHTPS